jgi:transposase InsO family protein
VLSSAQPHAGTTIPGTFVKIDFSRPGKLTDNAFVESFNGTFCDECLNVQWFESLSCAKIKRRTISLTSGRPEAKVDLTKYNCDIDKLTFVLKPEPKAAAAQRAATPGTTKAPANAEAKK